MPKLLICLVLFTTAWSSVAQDYIVTTKGDTLRGSIKLLTFDRLDKVQWKDGKSKAVYSALQVRSIYLDGEYYKPVAIDRNVQFMKTLKPGYLSLMAFRVGSQTTYDGRYLLKMDGTGIELPNLAFKKVMANFLSDCQQVQDRIKDEKLQRKDLDMILEAYNDCFQEKTVIAERARSAPEKSETFTTLKSKVETAQNVANRQDALDLLNDIIAKLKRGETVPNYQVEALKSFLKDVKDLQPALDAALAALASQ